MLTPISVILFQIIVLIVFFTVVYPIFGLNQLIRVSAQFMYRAFFPDEHYRLGSTWSGAFNWNANQYPYLTVYGVIKGSLNLDTIKQQLEDICNMNKTLKHLLLKPSYFGYCWFKLDKKFSIHNHVIQLSSLSCGGNEELDSALESYLVARPMSSLQPQWEILLIPLGEDDKTLVTLRMHHSYSDGVSLMLLGKIMLNNQLDFHLVQPIKTVVNKWQFLHALYKKITVYVYGPFIYSKYCLITLLFYRSYVNKQRYRQQPRKVFLVRSTRTINPSILKAFNPRRDGVSTSALLLDAVNKAVRKSSLIHTSSENFTINCITTPGSDEGTTLLRNRIVHTAVRLRRSESRRNIHDIISYGNRPYLRDSFLEFWMVWITTLPNYIAAKLVSFSAMPTLFTNLPPVLNQLKFGNSTLVETGGFSCLISNITLSIAFITYVDKLRVHLTTNSDMFQDQVEARNFADLVMKELIDILNESDR